MDSNDVAAVRAFTRFYTKVIGILNEGLLDTPYSVTEARMLFELGQGDQFESGRIRQTLGINAGHMSRIVTRFEMDGLVARSESPEDGRRQRLALTAHGREVYETLNRRSADQVEGLLSGLSASQRQQLVESMSNIQVLLDGESQDPKKMVVLRSPRPGDYGWVIKRHGELYREEYGWDIRFEALVARIVADFAEEHDPARESAWIAEVDGEPAGCVFCVAKDPDTAQLRILLVEPHTRGLGIGSLLVEQCVRFAQDAGYSRIVLWTNDVLESARKIYVASGFELVEEEQHHSFGHDLVGQFWARDL